ncbi:MAG TPA: HAMP domain-containing sensor histidine kinase [Methylomirabilota bacterium]|nr:HAMP domain-containing sensor histidine kinase [Methylomirabilota bacterium]
MRRRELLLFGSVLLASAILAALAALSLRQWEASAQRHIRDQARDMATMAVEKIEMAVLKAEEEALARLQTAQRDRATLPQRMDAWKTETPMFEEVYLFDRGGVQRYPPSTAGPSPLDALRAEIPPPIWGRGGRRHVALGDRVALVAVLPGEPPLDSLLAVLVRSEPALRRDVLEKTLAGLEGQSVLAVLDRDNRAVYVPRPLDRTEHVLTVDFGETLPSWRLALYEPAGLSPRDAVRRQAWLFAAAFGLLLAVITLGLGATYRLVRRESEMIRLKSDFVANVSHDLKTPLALIRMFGETLEMNRVPDEATRREYYGVITRESERLSRLIDNVLDFSRIEEGRRRYVLAAGSIEPVIFEVMEAFRHPLTQLGFKVSVEVEPDLPEVDLDAEAMQQAVANLVDNAIKYSDARRHLTVTARRADDAVAVAVADEGIGIPPREQERIFDKFYRVGHSDTQGRRGSGVGLALVKHIVDAHGGRVGVESRVGEGSRFTIILPAAGSAPSVGAR